ncbi:MAG: M28 family peptidase [Bacteroidia bacterium]
MKRNSILILSITISLSLKAQINKDSIIIRQFFETAFTNGKAYDWLRHLCKYAPGRISGSPQAEIAIKFAYNEMKNAGFDSVWLQPVMVPQWIRGEKETAFIFSGKKKTPVNICALGNSVGTLKDGLRAKVIEVKNFEELEKLGKENVEGKIVFFNRPFPDAVLTGGTAYGMSVNQRSIGPAEAAKFGAVGVVVRSMTHAVDEHPHTGATNYKDGVVKIPACAISTLHANLLSSMLQADPNTEFYFKQSCEMNGYVLSYNVVGQILGSEKPEEIILIGGHIDSWDNGEGAHDDGSGCVQSMDALRMFKVNNLKPKRTLRCVLFINEENGLKGAIEYARLAQQNNEKHLAAIETDAGGFMPREIGIDVDEQKLKRLQVWQKLLAPYGIQTISNRGGGADIGPLKNQGVVLVGYYPDGQKYFDYHHTSIDTFDKVNKRELQFGVVTLSGLLYLISEYGIN